jgi:hypothetical protein
MDIPIVVTPPSRQTTSRACAIALRRRWESVFWRSSNPVRWLTPQTQFLPSGLVTSTYSVDLIFDRFKACGLVTFPYPWNLQASGSLDPGSSVDIAGQPPVVVKTTVSRDFEVLGGMLVGRPSETLSHGYRSVT